MGPHESAMLDHWKIWVTPMYGQEQSWSAMPAGAMSAVIVAPDRETLEEKMSEYVHDLDAHVREARRKLDALPPHWAGERQVQESLIDALAKMRSCMAGPVTEP